MENLIFNGIPDWVYEGERTIALLKDASASISPSHLTSFQRRCSPRARGSGGRLEGSTWPTWSPTTPRSITSSTAGTGRSSTPAPFPSLIQRLDVQFLVSRLFRACVDIVLLFFYSGDNGISGVISVVSCILSSCAAGHSQPCCETLRCGYR